MDAMLRSLTAKQFAEWECYARLEPFNELREDYRTASIVTMLANVNRDSKQPAYKMADFVLRFGEDQAQKPQTWQEKLAIARAIVVAFSAPAKDL